MGFEILTADQLIQRLKGRIYKYSQIHHTWKPNHSNFDGKNHIKLQQGMYDYHVHTRGWDNIGQHVTLMPDGTFVTGRPFNQTPAGISGYNTGAFMVEMLGDFDKGQDKLESKQLDSMLKLQHFLTTECGATIMFHREHADKTCPGTGLDKTEFLKQVANYNTPKKDGWSKENSIWFFYKNGVKVKNQWLLHTDKKYYFLGEDGNMQVSKWIRWKNKWCYVNDKGIMLTGEQVIDGKKYFIRDNGYLVITDKNGAIVE